MAAPVARICRRCICSEARKTKPLVGRPRPHIDRIIRVDHAGELGADRIYAGQMAVLGGTDVGPTIQHMWDQEKKHLQTFEQIIADRRVRPTVLIPLWNVAGFVLGAGTALLGKEAAMACTVAVEEVISEHYDNQLRELLTEGVTDENKELLDTIQTFRDEELEHLHIGEKHDAEKAPMYQALSTIIQTGCKAAIWLSERI
ncbi:5-demethoxyubiquinone hydroxylase, mitochondrial-like isoform X1 [Porites lutea]|uniref:5-demethoxyubiquinone hydroxylase, mitochondrial-like isoform X1 n=1 Tax=Porites lutea TaxID=51062 RepID=UPI003CC5F6EF